MGIFAHTLREKVDKHRLLADSPLPPFLSTQLLNDPLGSIIVSSCLIIVSTTYVHTQQKRSTISLPNKKQSHVFELHNIFMSLVHSTYHISHIYVCFKPNCNYIKDTCKLCFETKSTKLEIGRFTSNSGHCFANYINTFHKTEVLTVILRG